MAGWIDLQKAAYRSRNGDVTEVVKTPTVIISACKVTSAG